MKPKHIAIIMDGNRRWAKSNNYSLLEAYERGLETLNDCLLYTSPSPRDA